MAVELKGCHETMLAEEDLSTYLYKFLQMGVTAFGVRHVATLGEPADYILAQEPYGVVGEAVKVCVGGFTKLEISGTVAIGDLIRQAADGTGVATSTTGHNAGAKAMEAGVTGDIIAVRVMPLGYQVP